MISFSFFCSFKFFLTLYRIDLQVSIFRNFSGDFHPDSPFEFPEKVGHTVSQPPHPMSLMSQVGKKAFGSEIEFRGKSETSRDSANG